MPTFLPAKLKVTIGALAAVAATVGFVLAANLVVVSSTARPDLLSEWPDGKCPTVDSGEAVWRFEVALDESRMIKPPVGEVDLTLHGVKPKWPGWKSNEFDFTNGAQDFLLDCLVGTYAEASSFSWKAGDLTASIKNIQPPLDTEDPEIDSSMGSQILFRPCPAFVDDQFVPIVCRKEVISTVEVVVPDLNQEKSAVTLKDYVTGAEMATAQQQKFVHAVDPFPYSVEKLSDGRFSYKWKYRGVVPDIKIGLDFSLATNLTYLVAGLHPRFWGIGIDGPFLAYALSSLAALVTVLAILWSRARVRWLVLLINGFLLIGGVVLLLPVSSCESKVLITRSFGWAGVIISLVLLFRPFLYSNDRKDGAADRDAREIKYKWTIAKIRGTGRVLRTLFSRKLSASILAVVLLATFALPIHASQPGDECAQPRQSGWDEFIWILPGGTALLLAAVGISLLLIRVMRLAELVGEVNISARRWSIFITSAATLPVLYFSAGYVLGHPFSAEPPEGESQGFRKLSFYLFHSFNDFGYSAVTALVQLVPLLLVSLCGLSLLEDLRVRRGGWESCAPIVAVLLSLAIPWVQSGSVYFIVNIPLWLVQFFVLLLFGKYLLNRQVSVPSAKSRDSLLECSLTEHSSHNDSGYELLARGPRDSVVGNAQFAASVAAVVSVVPVFYFVWSAFDQFDVDLSSGWQAFVIVIALLSEITRWLIAGFIFGFLYRFLPGRGGPVKALCFTAIWGFGCLLPVALARTLDVDVISEVLYRGAQLAIFLMIVGVVYDLSTLRAVGGSWRNLQNVYALNSLGELLAAVTPFLLVVVALLQQIAAGSGLDIAGTLVSGINDAVTRGGSASP